MLLRGEWIVSVESGLCLFQLEHLLAIRPMLVGSKNGSVGAGFHSGTDGERDCIKIVCLVQLALRVQEQHRRIGVET